MTARELMEELIALSDTRHDPTVDTLKAGDANRDVRKVATCFIATPDVVRAARAWGADLVITHEPTYYDHPDRMDLLAGDPVFEAKKALIESAGMTLWRWHDHIHTRVPDGIVEGVLDKLGWRGAYDGSFFFRFDEPMTARQMARDLREKLNLGDARVTGAVDSLYDSLILAVGAPGDDHLMQGLTQPGAVAMLAGEVCEWRTLEYARDAAQLGFDKAVITLGHCGSERAGMENAARIVRALHPELEVRYFEGGEVYAHI